MRLFPAFALILAAPTLVFAAPRVVTDIAPVHSLAAQVMDGVGQPALLIQPGASPHAYSLRPSEAQALQDAEIVFWIGEALTPWLERGIDSLAPDAQIVTLLGAGGSETLPGRVQSIFEPEGRKDHRDGRDGGEGDDHPAEARAHHGDAHDRHDHAGADPHGWLSPENAGVWTDLIAAALAKADPANAAAYLANAAVAKARIDVARREISSQLDAVRGRKFIVFHDAYQYFERSFDMASEGALTISDARKPSPARLAEIRDHLRDHDIACVFAEPQFNAGVVRAVAEGGGVALGVLDPLGSTLSPGPDFYGALLDDLATAMVACLSD